MKVAGRKQAQRFYGYGRIGRRTMRMRMLTKKGPLVPSAVLRALAVLGLPPSQAAYSKHLALLTAAYNDAHGAAP